MNPDINKCDLSQEYYFDEGCFITELSNTTDDAQVSIARARVETGKTTKWHYNISFMLFPINCTLVSIIIYNSPSHFGTY